MKTLDIAEIGENKMEGFKEFTFHIGNAKFTVLSDKGMDIVGPVVVTKKYDQLHFHTYYELFYVNSGKLTLKFEDGDREFEKDDLIIVSPGTNHKTILVDPGTGRYNLNFLMEKNSLKTNFSMYDALREVFSSDNFTCLSGIYILRDILKKIVVDIMQGDEIMLGMHFHELVANILDKADSPKPASIVNSTISDNNMIRMYKLQQIIFTTYSQDISLSYIAEKLFLSTRQASRIIQQYFGCTYRELVAKMRMKVAVELLENTNMTILEIASQIGYNSIKGFYTYFKKQYNCLPTEYRKRIRLAEDKNKS